MDNRPIGVFDSGLGGLTMVKKLAEYLPGEDVIYLGDTGRVPYGSRSKETIIKYAKQDAAFLMGHDIKAMVIACNTVCSVALDSLKESFKTEIYEVIGAPAKAAANITKNGKIGIIGTVATIKSGAYEAALKKINNDLEIYSTACPLFVPLVEEGWICADDTTALSAASRYLSELKSQNVDTLILGCTHYPLLKDVLSEVMGKNVHLIDSSAETAKQAATDLKAKNLQSDKKAGTTKYYVTDSTTNFSTIASKYLEQDVTANVEQVNLDY